jgi:hypothetical protein
MKFNSQTGSWHLMYRSLLFLFLQTKRKYDAGLAVVSANETGEIHLPAYIHKGYVRNLGTGKTREFPATIGISMMGMEM